MNSKLIVFVGLVVVLLFFGCTSSNSSDTSNMDSDANNASGLLTYTNYQWGVSIEYPAEWKKDEQSSFLSGTTVYFDLPKVHATDKTRDNVSLNRTNSSASGELDINSYAAMFHADNPDSNLLEIKKTSLAGFSAYWTVDLTKDQGDTFKIVQVSLIKKESNGFVFTYVSTEESYLAHIAQVEKMINSFKVN